MTHRGPFQPLLFCDSVILLSIMQASGVNVMALKGEQHVGPIATSRAQCDFRQTMKGVSWRMEERA